MKQKKKKRIWLRVLIFVAAFIIIMSIYEKIYPVVDGTMQISTLGALLALAIPILCAVYIPSLPGKLKPWLARRRAKVQVAKKAKAISENLSFYESEKAREKQAGNTRTQILHGTEQTTTPSRVYSSEPIELDEISVRAAEVLFETGQASVSMIQRRLSLGYAHAARIADRLERQGVIGPFDGAKPRLLLISKDEFLARLTIVDDLEFDAPKKPDIDVSQIIKEEHEWRREQMGLSSVDYELRKVDGMEGHDFEYWCADLLRKNGFTSVEVTRGSGDQGVDIIAQKDGIRYAIQCKCYSSDLGNKPVQEVYAGRTMYDCQVGAVMTNRHFTAGGKELAARTGVLLWDRDKLLDMLEASSL